MQDRELLELAARAWIAEGFRRGQYKSADEASSDLCKDGRAFNPLQDDGDAFRLAAKLRIQIEHSDHMVYAGTSGDDGEDLANEPVASSIPRERAMRRAIVRAAAEIGKKR